MPDKLSPSAQKVQDALAALGYAYQVVELPHTTRTAADAASALGCGVAQIVKSLVFKLASSNAPLLVVASGPNRVDDVRLGEIVGDRLVKADASFVREQTGFAIGGVPPLGHRQPIKTIIDRDLLKHDEVWAAAGTPNAVFRLRSADLADMTGGTVEDIK